MKRGEFLRKLALGVTAVVVAPELLAKSSKIQAGDLFELSVGPLPAKLLKVESLEASLRYMSFSMQDIKLWEALPRVQAENTVEEYNQLLVGSNEEEFLTLWPITTIDGRKD